VVSNAVKPATSEQQFVHDTMRFETSGMNVNCYECVTSDCARQQVDGKAIVIEKLRKVYPDGFTAVKGINLKLFSNQIFVLLGHNGAGKTSTIAMLTGLFPATEGEVEIFGCDLKTQLTTIRSFMGVCPQHDVLFELLTPAEHLDIFYEFKGGDKTKKHDEIERLLEDVGVADKRDTKSCQLSGGNKRKLSVAIALCGGSKFVLLDEPSSGLDLSARRELWNMLRK
jgi:ATP-binding cassette, subfamily A (ABC1), member 3